MVAFLGMRWNDHLCDGASVSETFSPCLLSPCPRQVRKAEVEEEVWTYLLVLELNQGIIVLDHLVAEVFRTGEQLWKTKPLSCHLVPV